VGESTYADAFGLQWLRYRRTQLDSYTGIPISARRLRQALGEDLWERLPGATVLECGCGAGRFTEVLLAQGASVTSIDLSAAVDANAANFPVSAEHRVAQADIMALPFAPQQFDLVLALGVVQHTPSPEDTIAHLYGQVRSAGSLVFDHYTFSVARLTKLSGLLRFVTKRLSPARGMQLTERLVDMFLPLHRRAGRLQPLVGRVSPIACYYQAYPELSDQLQREWSLLDTHDSLTDWYKRLRTPRQLERTLRRLGAEQIHCQRGGNGVEARGLRPGGQGGQD
jgi:SAM-dependent methyltransferase